MTIKTGDLVMVVRPAPCCGACSRIGFVFRVEQVARARIVCMACGQEYVDLCADIDATLGIEVKSLKKIDPPAEGDSLPTRADIEVAA